MPCAEDALDEMAWSADGADDARPDLLAELEASRRLLKRVRYDIHDGPLQEVAAFTHELHLLRLELADAGSPDARLQLEATVDGMLERLDDLAGHLREIALAKPTAREAQRSLESVLQRAVDLFLDSCAVELSVRLVDESALTDSQKIAIARIVQTSLANVAQHSGATLAKVGVADSAAGVAVEIWDNGSGFDVESCLRRATLEGHLGLVGILERVELLGGSLELDSRPGGPTTVSVFLPRATARVA